jgi:serine/threonine protein kinase
MNPTDPTLNASSHPPVSSPSGGLPQETLLQRGSLDAPCTPGTIGKLDRFEILRLLGEGGMGQVYLAREPLTDTQVAIKIMKPQAADDPQSVHRFLTEARHMYRLSHPRILRVLEVSDRRPGPYYVMPYIGGGSLLARYRPGEPLSDESILSVARQVAEALVHAHAHGLIHRDMKPGNVLLDKEGNAFLTDFGLVRTMFNDSIVDTTASHLEGTAPYMSPAVARGDAEDTRCDIYAFGAVLYELLTGQPPYTGRTPQIILDQILKGPPSPIREVRPKASPGLVRIAEGCMARELRDRYAAMADVLTDLSRVAAGQSPLGPHRSGSRVWRRFGLVSAATVLAALAVAAAAVWRLRPFSAATDPHLAGGPGGKPPAAQSQNTSVAQPPAAQPAAEPLPAPTNAAGWSRALAAMGVTYRGVRLDEDGRVDLDLSECGITNLSFLRRIPLGGLRLCSDPVSDISPLKGIPLKRLDLAGTQVSDLSPLKDMRLTWLDISGLPVSNVAVLAGMPLTWLSLSGTAVADLTPLTGLPLTGLHLRETRVASLEPLAGLSLTWLSLHVTSVTDISPIEKAPLTFLCLCGTKVNDLSALRGMRNLTAIHGRDVRFLLAPLRDAERRNDVERTRMVARTLISDWTGVPVMTGIVAEARAALVRADSER